MIVSKEDFLRQLRTNPQIVQELIKIDAIQGTNQTYFLKFNEERSQSHLPQLNNIVDTSNSPMLSRSISNNEDDFPQDLGSNGLTGNKINLLAPRIPVIAKNDLDNKNLSPSTPPNNVKLTSDGHVAKGSFPVRTSIKKDNTISPKMNSYKL